MLSHLARLSEIFSLFRTIQSNVSFERIVLVAETNRACRCARLLSFDLATCLLVQGSRLGNGNAVQRSRSILSWLASLVESYCLRA